ncbi:MAG TPA: response regulator [Planctomycetota bacterium]|jgi:CheY-like chemotaxis protein|nr:response regulator [Planctomycetota bacterium]
MSLPAVRILLAEDDPDDVVFLGKAFQKVGIPKPFRVLADGQDVISYLAGAGEYADREGHPLPTHLLLDLKLPRRSGLDILSWIRKDSRVPTLPVIVLTSSSQAQDRTKAEGFGVSGYFVKPVTQTELVGTAKTIATLWNLPPAQARA